MEDLTCRVCQQGVLEPVAQQLDTRRVIFNCNHCHENECLECTVCHRPRTIWADSGNICGICVLEGMDGQRTFTPEQLRAIDQWRIRVRVPVIRTAV